MSVLLYDNPASGNCYKVRLLLTMLGIEFERREVSVVDFSDRAAVLGGLSPSLTSRSPTSRSTHTHTSRPSPVSTSHHSRL